MEGSTQALNKQFMRIFQQLRFQEVQGNEACPHAASTISIGASSYGFCTFRSKFKVRQCTSTLCSAFWDAVSCSALRPFDPHPATLYGRCCLDLWPTADASTRHGFRVSTDLIPLHPYTFTPFRSSCSATGRLRHRRELLRPKIHTQ